jgi:hypothetical protein
MNDHEHDYWLTLSGRYVCLVCGAPHPAPEPSPAQQAEIDRFGIFDGPGIGESI